MLPSGLTAIACGLTIGSSGFPVHSQTRETCDSSKVLDSSDGSRSVTPGVAQPPRCCPPGASPKRPRCLCRSRHRSFRWRPMVRSPSCRRVRKSRAECQWQHRMRTLMLSEPNRRRSPRLTSATAARTVSAVGLDQMTPPDAKSMAITEAFSDPHEALLLQPNWAVS